MTEQGTDGRVGKGKGGSLGWCVVRFGGCVTLLVEVLVGCKIECGLSFIIESPPSTVFIWA